MALNQVSMSFYTRRWQQRLTPDPRARTGEGEPVLIADAVPVPGADDPALPTEAVVAWLTAQGFTPVEWGRLMFERGQVQSLFGLEKEIEVSVGAEAGEVCDLCCRFTLPRQTQPALNEWAAFGVALCHRFGLRLAPDGASPCGEAEFLAAVRADRNYQDFAASFGWHA